ncbi:MAG TPA: hypothetical protein VMU76_05350 [Acidimicrobiales bacterium]|nr:hypothetical protein [Acidimicrobiales bacterium]
MTSLEGERDAPASHRKAQTGIVESFDPDRGLGSVVDPSGRTLPFHCTAIADGTRLIDVGTPVTYLVAAGLLGRLEARGLVRTTAAPADG